MRWSENMPKKCKLNAIFVREAQSHDRSRTWWWSQQQCTLLRENNFGNNQICMSRSLGFNIDRSIRWSEEEEEKNKKKNPKMMMSIIKEGPSDYRVQNKHDDRDITINAYCYLISINSPLCLDNTSPPLDRSTISTICIWPNISCH